MHHLPAFFDSNLLSKSAADPFCGPSVPKEPPSMLVGRLELEELARLRNAPIKEVANAVEFGEVDVAACVPAACSLLGMA